MKATVFTVAQHKGGAGKTTLAAHLAVSWLTAGRSVALVDIDPQGSLTAWYRRRLMALGERAGRLHLSHASGWRVRSEVEGLSRSYDVIIVDSPPQDGPDTRLAMRLASLVVVPVQPSPLDVWATRPTLDLTQQEKVASMMVLNRVPARARLTGAMVEEIAKLSSPVARAWIGNRTAFAATLAAGIGVADPSVADEIWCIDAAQEIKALSRELARRSAAADQRLDMVG
jgi:chromosome partitioning protein